MKEKLPIGIFDSGVGGLTVAKEIKRLMPNEDLIYFGDTKHLPYGDKSKEAIIRFTKSITKFLLSKNCKAIVVACNTATANAIDEIKEIAEGKALVFDVISPVVEKVAYNLNQNIGVIATKSTIESHIYKRRIQKLNKHVKVSELATPLLVPTIEEGFINHPVSEIVLKTYLSNPKLKNIDSLILGCTHYPLVNNEVNSYYQNKIQIFDSPLIMANHIKYELDKNKMLADDTEEAEYNFYVSDYTPNFNKQAKKFFGNDIELKIKSLTKYDLEKIV